MFIKILAAVLVGSVAAGAPVVAAFSTKEKHSQETKLPPIVLRHSAGNLCDNDVVDERFQSYWCQDLTDEPAAWNRKYGILMKDQPQDGDFSVKDGPDKKVEEAFSQTNEKALNKVCRRLKDYSTELENIYNVKNSRELWKYCDIFISMYLRNDSTIR